MPVSSYNASNYWVDLVFNTVLSGSALLGSQATELVDGHWQAGNGATGMKKPFALLQNAPNPSRGVTVIRYSLPVKSKVNLSLYDIQGRQVRVLVDALKEPGEHRLEVDTRTLGKGVYFYRMQADGFMASKRLVVE